MAKQERTPQQQEAARLKEVTQTIAAQLGETEEEPLKLLRRIVKRLGTEEALAFLHKTLEVEAQGGMMISDGSRRRTPGGTFFFLVRTTGPKRVRPLFWQEPPKDGTTGASTQQPYLSWADRLSALDEIDDEKGTISTVKITVVGRPGKVADRGTCVVTSMESSKVPSLPKGLPVPPSPVTKYTVYIAMKQWRKISDAIRNPDDVLILEGYPYFDDKSQSIAVFVTSATTKLLQQQRKAEQQETAQS